MANSEPITLVFLTDHGTQERMHVDGSSMTEARRAAEKVLREGAGLYVHADIQAGGRIVEQIETGELSEIADGNVN